MLANIKLALTIHPQIYVSKLHACIYMCAYLCIYMWHVQVYATSFQAKDCRDGTASIDASVRARLHIYVLTHTNLWQIVCLFCICMCVHICVHVVYVCVYVRSCNETEYGTR